MGCDDCLELESSMAERSRLRAPDLGAQLGVPCCVGKCRKSSPEAGRWQPFSGKSFFLDLPAGKNLQFLTGAIPQLGGLSVIVLKHCVGLLEYKDESDPLSAHEELTCKVIEGFLSKEVSYIVSSRREVKTESSGTSHRGCSSPSDVRVEIPSVADPKDSHARPSQNPTDSVPMSRGKELLQKAIRNQGSSSSLLTNARSWGVRILHVDEMMMHVQRLSLDALCVRKHGPKKLEGTCPAESRTRKVTRLKAPFLKIEDESRNFRPFHHQFKSFPEISFLGPKDASPFEAPTTTLGSSHHTREPKDQEPTPRSAARTLPRRKKGYCECCQEAFEELHGHLQSAQHQGFALEAHPYAEVDRIIARLSHSFADVPFEASPPRQPRSPASDCDPLCPATLPRSQSSCAEATSPRKREEDSNQALGIPEQGRMVGGMKAPAEHMGTAEIPGPVASCQELRLSVDVIVDSPGTPASNSSACLCLLTSSGFADLYPGLDLALVGHKRKVQFPSGNAEKRPQTSFFVSRAPCASGTRTTDSEHLFLSLPGHKPKPPASLLPLCHPQTNLSLPDPLPWQPTDRPSELWAAQPPWPRGGYSPGSEGCECVAPSHVSQKADQLPSCPSGPGQLSAHLHRGGPVESPATSPPDPLPSSRGASCSR